MTPTAAYGATFAQWCAGCPDSWRAYTHHAFFKGLGHGPQPGKAFLHYLVQAPVFLVHFAQAWSHGVIKAVTLDEVKVCAETVDAMVNHEMALHVKTSWQQLLRVALVMAKSEQGWPVVLRRARPLVTGSVGRTSKDDLRPQPNSKLHSQAWG